MNKCFYHLPNLRVKIASTYIFILEKKTKHQIVLPNEQENTHPQHIFPNQIKHLSCFPRLHRAPFLKSRQEDPCCFEFNGEILSSEIPERFGDGENGDVSRCSLQGETPKKPDFIWYRTVALCYKTPVCKNGPKIQGFNKAISGGAFLHAGKKRWSDGGGPYL